MTAMANGRLRWAVNITQWTPGPADWPLSLACVQLEEKKRINEFVFAEDATLSLIGRLLLRVAVIHLTGMKNDKVKFERTEKGKPYLVELSGTSSLELNVSHQGNYAVLAAEMNRKVGVDVMQLTRPRGIGTLQQFFTTMNRQFSNNEWKQIQAPPTESQQLALFYRHWCLKESYIKAIGTGLSHGLERLEFKLNPLSHWEYGEGICVDTNLSVDGNLVTIYMFEESLLDREHCVSVAVAKSDMDCSCIPFTELTISYLLSKLDPLRTPDQSDWLLHFKRPHKSK